MRPVRQLSSMNLRTEDWSVTLWSTVLGRVHGEITSRGSRGP